MRKLAFALIVLSGCDHTDSQIVHMDDGQCILVTGLDSGGFVPHVHAYYIDCPVEAPP
jgi:hypothetical protein